LTQKELEIILVDSESQQNNLLLLVNVLKMLASTSLTTSLNMLSLNRYYGACTLSSRVSMRSIIVSFFYSLNSRSFFGSLKSADL